MHFNKEDDVDRKEDQVDVEQDPDKEDIEDAKLDGDREHRWRVVFEDRDGGVGDKKALLYSKR